MTIQDDIDAAHAAVNRLAGRLRDESDARARAERALAGVGPVGTYPARSIPLDDGLVVCRPAPEPPRWKVDPESGDLVFGDKAVAHNAIRCELRPEEPSCGYNYLTGPAFEALVDLVRDANKANHVLHADIDAWPGHACVQPDPFPEDGLWECPTCSRVWRTSKRIHEDAEAARRGRGVL